MIGVALLLTTVAVALSTVRRPWIPIAGAIAVFVLVPQVASATVGVSFLSGMHLGTVVIVVTAGVQFVVRGREYVTDLVRSFPVYAALAVCAAIVFLTGAMTGTSSSQFLVESVFGGALVFTLIRRALADDPRVGTWLPHTFIAVTAIEAAWAILVWLGALPQPFAEQYAATYYWYTPDFSRALGTADSPLNLAVVMTAATCLLLGVRRLSIIAPCAALFLTTIFAAEARAALVLSLAALVVIMVRRRVPFVTFSAIGLTAGALLVVAVLALPDLTEGLVRKFSNDDGSANARQIGLDAGLPSALGFPVFGGGPDSAVSVARALGLGTSFENPVIMLALNWGVLGTLCYFGAQVGAILARSDRPRPVAGGRLAAVATLAAILTFSSIAFASGLGSIVWVVVAFAAPPLPVSASVGGTSTNIRADTHSSVSG